MARLRGDLVRDSLIAAVKPANGEKMLSFDELIEVGQDGVGIIEENNKAAKGFFTVGVESCLVTTYFFKKATVIIHDSSQLKLSEIFALIKKYGAVRKLIVVWGNGVSSHHKERLQTLMKLVALSRRDQLVQVQVPQDNFAFMCATSGEYEVCPNFIPAHVLRIPEKEKRQAVCEVNNFFAERNAQSLALDVQYREGHYAPVRTLDKTLDELLTTLRQQPDFFFQNIAMLHGAQKHGLLMLPQALSDVAVKYTVDRFRVELPSPQDKVDEAREFRAYVDALPQST